MSNADPNVVIVTGENPFIRLSVTDSDDYTTNASGASSSPLPGRDLTWYDIGDPLLIHTQPNTVSDPRRRSAIAAASPAKPAPAISACIITA